MRSKMTKTMAAVMLASLMFGDGATTVSALGAETRAESVAEQGKTSATRKRKASKKGKQAQQTAGKQGKKAGRKETSQDVKKRQDATQKEIRLTEEQIRQNDARIKTGLSDLSRISGQVESTRRSVGKLQGEVRALGGRISGLQTQIKTGESDLARLRAEYLKAVKKMRLTRKNRSALAFLFSSDNFNQALRRMRYMQQFSAWKEKQSAAINAKVADLRRQTTALAAAKSQQDVALSEQRKAQARLESQEAQQNRLVAELRANGAALNDHLRRKQAEANDLRNRVAALIAAEEQARIVAEEKVRREAEERERRAAEERERRAAEERARAEAARQADEAAKARERARIAEENARKAEQERIAAEQRAKEDAARKAEARAKAKEAEEARKTAEKARKEAERAEKEKQRQLREKAEQERKEKEKAEKEARKAAKKRTHAEARNRRSRKKGGSTYTEPTKSPTPASTKKAPTNGPGSNFAAMKGLLPRPVDGHFRVTSQFGRHALPDLPDVMYDNPGVDIEVSDGATAKAVYGGKVSGVYSIPGFATVVIVNHGNYYTVYGNLAGAGVKVGDNVKAGQSLGKVASDPDNRGLGSLHFEVWKNREKQNPMSWIR